LSSSFSAGFVVVVAEPVELASRFLASSSKNAVPYSVC